MTDAAPALRTLTRPPDAEGGATLPARSRIDVSALDRFEIDAEIGRGGMAVVYAARDKETGERVALKVVSGPAGGVVDEGARARFHREVKAASQLLHPGICRVLAFGVDGPSPFLAMEYIEGGTLWALMKKAPIVPGVIAAEILRQLLEALACAHAAGVVHRDLKPQNVMVTPSGAVKLLDFGIAKSVDDETLTQTGILVGTPAFMSPEQARAEVLDGRSDLFSAAMTIAALVRKSPHRFSGGARLDPTQMLLRVAYEPHGPIFERAPHVPLGLDLVLASMTALVPDNRAPSASAALVALKDAGVLPKDGPALLASFATDPVAVSTRLALAQQQEELALAASLERKAGGEYAAALALHRAWHLMPSDDVAARAKAHNAKHKLTFDDVKDPRIAELMVSFGDNPSHPGILKGLADRHRALGQPKHAAGFLWRYVVERPDDGAAAQQLNVMLFGPTLDVEGARAPVTGSVTALGQRLSTQSIVAGIKSGGMKRATPAASSVPTRAMQRPVQPRLAELQQPMAALAPLVVHAGEPSGFGATGTTKLVMLGLAAVPLSLALYFVVSSVSLAKSTMQRDTATETKSVSTAQATQTASTLMKAEQALAGGDPSIAQGIASEVLINHPSLEAGRSALWVRARASAALGQTPAALKDCEIYLEKATDFDDPHIGEVKRLMTELRSSHGAPPQGLLE